MGPQVGSRTVTALHHHASHPDFAEERHTLRVDEIVGMGLIEVAEVGIVVPDIELICNLTPLLQILGVFRVTPYRISLVAGEQRRIDKYVLAWPHCPRRRLGV